jgi:hypothetical protein
VAEEGARVITALPTAKVLSTARQMVASQIVLIILSPKPEHPTGSLSIQAVKGQVKGLPEECA